MLLETKITKIEMQKRKKDRVNVYIDGEYSFSCSSELIFAYSLKTGQSVDIQKLNSLVMEDNYISAKNYALKLIEKNFKSENEVHKKLMLKDYGKPAVEKTMEFLKEYDFVNDVKYTEMYVNEKSKTQGKNKIKYELLKKGIAEEIIDNKVNSINWADSDELTDVMRKKYVILLKNERDPMKLYRKMYSFLIRKGYNYEEFKTELKHLINID